MSFKFDPNSTKNQGRWRLRDPNDFHTMWTEQDKNYEGISYIVGSLYNEEKAIQAIRFNKTDWDEEKAAKWWQTHKSNYCKSWSEKDWQEWILWKEENMDNKLKKIKVSREKGLSICRDLATVLKLKYITPQKITIDYEFEKDCLLPVGSIRQGKDIIGDVDVIITCSLTKQKLNNLNIVNIKDVIGGEKRIDFKYFLKDGFVNVNVFVFKDAKSWGAALLHSSGPYLYNIRLRNLLHSAKWIKGRGEGWKLSQNGLINNEGKIENTPTERSLQKILGVTERRPKER
jgi:DNA polymerase/3'-5' exonuclease PolX